jgi:hypothetical protein
MSEDTKKPAPKAKTKAKKPAPKPSHDLPELKRTRTREVAGRKPGSVRKVAEGFFVPGPLAAEYERNTGNRFICPAGAGMQPIPAEGQWYPVTTYLLKQVRDGAAAEGNPPADERADIKLEE